MTSRGLCIYSALSLFPIFLSFHSFVNMIDKCFFSCSMSHRLHPLLDSMGITVLQSQSRIHPLKICINVADPRTCLPEYVGTPVYIRLRPSCLASFHFSMITEFAH